MRKVVVPFFILLVVLGTAAFSLAEAPRVLISKPVDGATGVPVDVGEIGVFFSQPMDTGSWSLFEIPGLEYPPGKNDGPPWRDGQSFVLKVQRLKPGTKYGLQLNNDQRQGFKAKDGTPLAPTAIRFETAGRTAEKEPAPEKKPAPGKIAPPRKEPVPQPGEEKKPKQPLTEEEKITLHIMGGMLSIFFHELGHGLVHMYELPITGKEEDAVDEFALMLLLFAREEGAERIPEIILGYADLFRLCAKSGKKMPYWDEHSMDMVRFANTLCLLYGSSPEEFQDLVKKFNMPERRQYFCKKDYPKRRKAWEKMLHDHLKEFGAQGPGRMTVSYGEVKSDFARKMMQGLKNERVFESLAEGITKALALPYDVTIVLKECGVPNAFWSPKTHEIIFCYEMIKFYIDLLDKDIAGGGSGGNSGGGGGSGGGQTTRQGDNRLVGLWGARYDDQGITYIAKVLFDNKGQYHLRHEQWNMGQMYYWEDEFGRYAADGRMAKFKVEKRSDGKNRGNIYAYNYVIQSNRLVFKNVPSLNGADLVLQKLK